MTFSNSDLLSSSVTGVNRGKITESRTYLNEVNFKKQLVISISQRSEELRPYNLVHNLTISHPGLKAVSSNASPG
jgi:hypothetical protein